VRFRFLRFGRVGFGGLFLLHCSFGKSTLSNFVAGPAFAQPERQREQSSDHSCRKTKPKLGLKALDKLFQFRLRGCRILDLIAPNV
jgi:hypothetical protein